MFSEGLKFFEEMPKDVKASISYVAEGNRGWSPIGSEKLS
jgi:hypothetical protein